MQSKHKRQQKRLSANVRNAKARAKSNRTDLKTTVPNKKTKTPPAKQTGGVFASLAARFFGRADKPQTAQQSIPYREMFRDGICRVNERLYTKTIAFQDINYHLAQNEDKTQIFENYCDFLNYFDASVSVQLSFINKYSNMEEFQKSIDIPATGDGKDDLRVEYSGILKNQQAKGNNGLVKTKFVTFGIEADNLKAAKLRIERVEADILNNFKVLGVSARSLTGAERLEILHGQFHPDGNEHFRFNWKDIPRTGMSTKDFVAPTSFDFRDGNTFRMYSKDLGVKIRSSFALKQQKGELLGSLPPYGYMFTSENGGKRLKIEPESAKIVKLIFDMREQGNSMVKIAEHLNRNDVLAPRNHYHRLGVLTNDKDAKKALWQNGYIGNLLRNEVYVGRQIQGKFDRRGKQITEKPRSEWIVHENAHPAIIDLQQFNAVQQLLNESGEKFKKLGNKLDDNILVGKIFCSRCGKALKRQYYYKSKKHKNEVKYRYYCPDCCSELRHSMGLEKTPHFPLEEIEGAITVLLQKRMDTCFTIDTLIEDVINSGVIVRKRHMLTTELNKYQRDSKKAEDMLAAAYTHHLAGLLDSREFGLAREKFERDKRDAEIGAERITQELTGYDLEKARHNAFLTNFRRFKGFEKLDKAIISALIERIEVAPLTKEVRVTLNFTDDFERLNKLVEESEVLNNVC